MISLFQRKYPFYERLLMTKKIMLKYPDKIPIICEKYFYAKNNCPNIEKIKYLVPFHFKIYEFMQVIRNQIKLNKEEALYMIVNGDTMVSQESIMIHVYHKYKNIDDFLYINYNIESTFGHGELR